MNKRARTIFVALLLLVFSVFLPKSTPAQCNQTFVGILAVGDMPGSPLQADLQFDPVQLGEAATWPHQEVREHLVRDGQGRIRFYKLSVAAGSSEEAPQNVTICDPVEGKRIFLDAQNKEAVVRKMNVLKRQLRTRGTVENDPGHFCTWQLRIGWNMNGGTVVDLGRRSLQGVSAQGSLEHTPPLPSQRTPDASAPQRPTYTSEVWCSEELGAVVQRIMGTLEKGTNRTATMTNIERGEPDPALFQIPPGYHVKEYEDRAGTDWQ